ncbi:hypothetical protein [Thermococcus sp.]|nr:hypothetical protein [Thermococcus sp.]
MNYSEIARRTELPESTVRLRMKNLLKGLS